MTNVFAGADHSLALASDGELYGWGRNDLGQLGLGHTTNQLRPVRIPRPDGVGSWKDIAVGAHHVLALGNNGQLYSWGFNHNGQLGIGTNSSGPGALTPVMVSLPQGSPGWDSLGATGTRSLGLDRNCQLYEWGGEGNGLAGDSGPSFSLLRPVLMPQLADLCADRAIQPPSVVIVSPVGGTVLSGPTNLVLEAQASVVDGRVTRVEFYSSGDFLGAVTNAPFKLLVTNLEAGVYTFTATATADSGAKVMSRPCLVSIIDPRFFQVRINFQPAGADPVPGYEADVGEVYGLRGNGLYYGWSADNTANMVKRDSVVSLDERYDTFAYMQRGGDFSWRIALTNGYYRVRFVRGDPVPEPHFFQTSVGNWLIGESGLPNWDDNTIPVLQVRDGFLSVGNPPGAANNKICFIEIQGIEPPPVLSFSAVDAVASEGILDDGTTNTAKLVLQRTGSTDKPLDVSYSTTGSASNGVDFYLQYEGTTQVLSTNSRGFFHLAAGQDSVGIILWPIENELVETNKEAIFTIQSSPFYALNQTGAATVTISNNDFIATNAPLAIQLSSPDPTVDYVGPTNLLLQAIARPAAGTIQELVYLLDGTTVLGKATAPPFSVLWTNAQPGLHSLVLRALNSQRATIYSVPMRLFILSAAPPQPAQLALEPTSNASYLINTNGMLFVWGANDSGQLGIGSTTNVGFTLSVPYPPGVTAWRGVSGGRGFAVAIANNGQAYAWGQNTLGQLGRADTNLATLPTPVSLPTGVTAWRVAAGTTHTLLLDSFGQLYAWGENMRGQLGIGNTNTPALPQKVPDPVGVTGWSAIAAGSYFSLALAKEGDLYAWGDNQLGQLGNGVTDLSTVPMKVPLPEGETWKAIAAGSGHALALTREGRLYSWGLNSYYQLGYSTTNYSQAFPVALPPPSGSTSWKAVTAGALTTLALANDGTLHACGYSLMNSLGTGTSSWVVTNLTPVLMPAGVSRWQSFTAGAGHCLAIGDDCTLYAWGNAAWALGNADILTLTIPTKVGSVGNLCFPADVARIDSAGLIGGQFQLRLTGPTDTELRVQASTNLVDWQLLQTDLVNGAFFSESNTSPARFYRLLIGPHP